MNMALRASKCANVIRAISELSKMPIQKAVDIFYASDTFELMEDGVADLQCRSDKYLATIVLEEYREKNIRQVPLTQQKSS